MVGFSPITGPVDGGGCPDAHRVLVLAYNTMVGTDARVPGWQLMGSDQYLAWGYRGCPNYLWTRQDDFEDVKGCNKLLE